MAPLLDVKDLHVEFMTRDGVVKAVNGITFALERGKVLTRGSRDRGKRHLALSRQVAAQGQDTALGRGCPEGDEPLRAFRGEVQISGAASCFPGADDGARPGVYGG